jgi:uncharacterized protein YgbK (DUF1537 family)
MLLEFAGQRLREVLSGIPAVRLVGGKGDGMRVVIKAGVFGDEDALAEAINYLKKECS